MDTVKWAACAVLLLSMPAHADPVASRPAEFDVRKAYCLTGSALVECGPRPDRPWHLLQTGSDRRIISLIHGLTKAECEFVQARALGMPATPAEREADRIAKETRRIAREAAEKEAIERQAALMKERPECVVDGRLAPWSAKDQKCRELAWGGVTVSQSGMYMPGSPVNAECFE